MYIYILYCKIALKRYCLMLFSFNLDLDIKYLICLCLFFVACSSASEHNINVKKGKLMVLKAVQSEFLKDNIVMENLINITYPEQSRAKVWSATFVKSPNRYLVSVSRQGKIIKIYKAQLNNNLFGHCLIY